MDYRINIIYTSDTHGFWQKRQDDHEHSLLNTAAAIKNLKTHFKAIGEPYITIDLGDFIQGSSFATYLNQENGDGTVFARAMNHIGYDYQMLGNHEFNFGLDYLKPILNNLKAEILTNNIIDIDSGKPALGVPYAIHEIDELKVGIIGTTTHYIPNWEREENYAGLTFLDAFEETKKAAEMLRPQVDILIVGYHGGFESDIDTGTPLEAQTGENQAYRMLSEIEGIDVLLTGHQHRLINQNSKHTITMQPGFAGAFIGHVSLEITDNKLTAMTSQLIDTNDFEADRSLIEVMQPEFSNASKWLGNVLGNAPIVVPTEDTFKARIQGTPFIEMINQIQLEETGADFSATTLINDNFSEFTGEITRESLLSTYPYYNLIAKVKVTGQELFEIMNYNLKYVTQDARGKIIVNPNYLDPKPKHYNWDMYSGLKAFVDMYAVEDKRLMALVDERTGKSIERDKEYTLAISQYRAVGGGDYHWFTHDKIISFSEVDIASLIPNALNSFDAEDWRNINTNYSHIKWI